MSKIKIHPTSPLQKKARRGFRGYPVATIACYGPNNERASKVAVGIIAEEDAGPIAVERWLLEERDIRTDPEVAKQILAFIEQHAARSVTIADHILGCPHEEGIDYPNDQVCPRCPFWAHRDRWAGVLVR